MIAAGLEGLEALSRRLAERAERRARQRAAKWMRRRQPARGADWHDATALWPHLFEGET